MTGDRKTPLPKLTVTFVIRLVVVLSGIVFHAFVLLLILFWLDYEEVDAGFLVVSATLLTVVEMMLAAEFIARRRARHLP